MLTAILGRKLFELCKSKEDKVAEVNALFEILSEDLRREAVGYRSDKVSEFLSEPSCRQRLYGRIFSLRALS